MRLPSVLRSGEWWEYKLLPIILIAYITAFKSGADLLSIFPWILFLFFSLVAGASYVSLINDITDIDEDIASGKKNRMVNIAPGKRWLLPAASVIAGIAFGYVYADHIPSLLLYLFSWIAFSCYSIPPVRLKKRGIWGVLADACGSQLFPSLLMVSFISFKTGQPLHIFWFIAVACWSFAFGMRGILWHQYQDFENDKQVGLRTMVTYLSSAAGQWITTLLLSIELISLAAMLYYYDRFTPILFLTFYAVYVVALYKMLQAKPIAIKPPASGPYHILMSDYYQVLFPLAVLFDAAISNPNVWFVMAAHILLFPRNLYIVILNTTGFFRSILSSKSI